MEEHSALCSQLDECVGDESGLDAFLTRLANFIEQHAEDLMARRGITEGPLPDDVEDMDVLLNCCRATAALQPDSTSDPALKCKVCNSVCPPFALTNYFPSRIFLVYRLPSIGHAKFGNVSAWWQSSAEHLCKGQNVDELITIDQALTHAHGYRGSQLQPLRLAK